MFLYQGMLAALGFGLLSVGLGMAQGYAGEWSALVIFATGMAAIAACTLQRDLAYALDKETAYESLETGRRAASVLAYLGIWKGIPLEVIGLFALLAGVGSYLFLNRLLMSRTLAVEAKETTGDAVTHWHQLRPGIRSKALRCFGFSINEVVFYNTPLIMFFVYPVPENIIYFGVWSKLFLLLVLPVRIFIDTRMNHVTALYFSANRTGSWRALSRCLQVGAGLAVPALVMLCYSQDALLSWMKAQRMLGDPWLLLSLGLWVGGNIVQHTYGTFTISYQDGFSLAYLNSFIALVLVSGTLIGSYLVTQNLGQSLAWAGGVYIFSALIYVWHVFQVTREGSLAVGGE
jgi:hypothetical protein